MYAGADKLEDGTLFGWRQYSSPVEALKNNSSLIWFLAGSGVLLLGLLIGVIAGKKSKKRYSSLL